MEKALIFSDLHVHQYRQFNENGRRLRNGIAFIDYIFKLAHANNIQYILMPGDLFNNMQIMATKAVNAVAKCMKSNFDQYDVRIIAVSGNHDMAEKNLMDTPAESALEYLDSIFTNFFLIDNLVFETENRNVIWGLPYYEHPEHFRKATELLLSKFEARKGKSYLLMHQTVASGLPIEDTIEPDDILFERFHMVFNGHIHNCEQVTDRFINIGTPMHRDGGDIGKAKGFWIVDLDDPINTIAFKDITTKYPQFIRKTQGEELTQWESEQYIIWQPAQITDNAKDQKLAEKFSTNLAPSKIMENYCAEVLPKEEVKDKLAYGLTLIS